MGGGIKLRFTKNSAYSQNSAIFWSKHGTLPCHAEESLFSQKAVIIDDNRDLCLEFVTKLRFMIPRIPISVSLLRWGTWHKMFPLKITISFVFSNQPISCNSYFTVFCAIETNTFSYLISLLFWLYVFRISFPRCLKSPSSGLIIWKGTGNSRENQ